MIEGYFKRLDYPGPPAPYVRAAVLLAGMRWARYVDFLIDTGADTSCLHPRDVQALEVDPAIFDPAARVVSEGIGGTLNYITHQADLVFGQSPHFTIWQCAIDVCDIWSEPGNNVQLRALPSLIGRDLLNLCRIRADPSAGEFVLDPIRQDGFQVLPP